MPVSGDYGDGRAIWRSMRMALVHCFAISNFKFVWDGAPRRHRDGRTCGGTGVSGGERGLRRGWGSRPGGGHDGLWFVRSVSNVILWAEPWGQMEMTPVSGDYDGDGVSDLAMYMERLGLWFIRSASGELLLWGGAFGGTGFAPVSGDFNGDGASDLAVYGNGLWFIRTVDPAGGGAGGTILQWGVSWGGPGFQAAGR